MCQDVDGQQMVGVAEDGGRSGVERVRATLAAMTMEETPSSADAVRAVLRNVDEFSRVSSVRKQIGSYSVNGLKRILENRVGRAGGGRKKPLIDAIMASYDWSADGMMAFVLPFGEERVRHVQGLVTRGDFECDKDLAERDPDAFAANVVSCYPVTFLMDVKGHFIVRLSDEAAKVLAPLTDEDWDRYAERAKECMRVRAAVPAVVDLYGVIEARDAIMRCAHAVGSSLDEGVLMCLAQPNALGRADGIGTLWHEGAYYFVSGHLSHYLEITAGWYPTDAEKDEYQVKTILKARGMAAVADLPEGLFEAGSVAALVAASEEGLDLMHLFDDNCPEELDRATFAPRALVFLTRALQDRDVDMKLEDLVESILEFDLDVLVYDVARDRVMEVVRRLGEVVPRWRLGGASPRERGLCDHTARPAWATEDDLKCGGNDCLECIASDDDEDDWDEPDVSGMRKRNYELLDEFWFYQRDLGISGKTASERVSDAGAYLNFLAGYMGEPMEEGTEIVDKFLGNYFIRRCTWSTPKNIPTTATGIVRFYECMVDYGYVDSQSVEWMKRTIEEDMEEWQRKCAQYNDPSAEMPFTFYDTLL